MFFMGYEVITRGASSALYTGTDLTSDGLQVTSYFNEFKHLSGNYFLGKLGSCSILHMILPDDSIICWPIPAHEITMVGTESFMFKLGSMCELACLEASGLLKFYSNSFNDDGRLDAVWSYEFSHVQYINALDLDDIRRKLNRRFSMDPEKMSYVQKLMEPEPVVLNNNNNNNNINTTRHLQEPWYKRMFKYRKIT